jgi:hypothetical protein
MRDRIWIFAGLALFVAALTTPFWYARARGTSSDRFPELVLPTSQKNCMAPAATMRAEHMTMLISWREDAVRHGDHRFAAPNGKAYEKSLTGTCLGCHTKSGFCDRCHAYSGVSSPSCWNCHNEPQQAVARRLP